MSSCTHGDALRSETRNSVVSEQLTLIVFQFSASHRLHDIEELSGLGGGFLFSFNHHLESRHFLFKSLLVQVHSGKEDAVQCV